MRSSGGRRANQWSAPPPVFFLAVVSRLLPARAHRLLLKAKGFSPAPDTFKANERTNERKSNMRAPFFSLKSQQQQTEQSAAPFFVFVAQRSFCSFSEARNARTRSKQVSRAKSMASKRLASGQVGARKSPNYLNQCCITTTTGERKPTKGS